MRGFMKDQETFMQAQAERGSAHAKYRIGATVKLKPWSREGIGETVKIVGIGECSACAVYSVKYFDGVVEKIAADRIMREIRPRVRNRKRAAV